MVQPNRAQAGSLRTRDVDLQAIAHENGVAGRNVETGQGVREDARVGLLVADLAAYRHLLEERVDAQVRELGALLRAGVGYDLESVSVREQAERLKRGGEQAQRLEAGV